MPDNKEPKPVKEPKNNPLKPVVKKGIPLSDEKPKRKKQI